MRISFQKICCLTVVFTLVVLFTISCSLIKSSEPQPKPKPKPKPTAKPEPTPTPQPPDTEKIIQTGLRQLEAGEINKAIASFEKAVAIEPDNSQAETYLQKAREMRDQLIEESLHQGIKYFSQEQLEDAMREWDKILELNPSHEEALKYKKRTKTMLDALQESK